MNECTIIAVANQKGGVGKTTTTFNLGAALALNHDKRVLLVDLDPQANLTEYLGYKGGDDRPTMTQLIAETVRTGAVLPSDVKFAIRTNELNKLDYIPSDINLANAETMMSTALARETILRRVLSPDVIYVYDYVLIDCLPSLRTQLINALAAADKLLIPVQTQKFSLDGLQALTSLFGQIKATINPDIEILGMAATMADNTNVSKAALRKLGEFDRGKLMKTVIHKSVEAARSSENGRALCLTKHKLGAEYAALAEEVIGPDTNKEAEIWEELWKDIYNFQNTVDTKDLPDDEDQLEEMGLYIARGHKGEKIYIDETLSKRLFYYRMMY